MMLKFGLQEGEEIYIELKGKKYLITPNPFDSETLELRAGNHEKGFDVVEIISSLDEVVTFAENDMQE